MKRTIWGLLGVGACVFALTTLVFASDMPAVLTARTTKKYVVFALAPEIVAEVWRVTVRIGVVVLTVELVPP